MIEWHKAEVSDITLEFGTDVNSGRTNVNSKRKRKHGNDVFRAPYVDSNNIVRKIASDASLILLTATYIIAALFGHHFEALVAIPIIIASFSFACFIRYHSEKRMNGSYKMLFPKARVIENGIKLSLSALDVEVGDLIYFGKGDIVPADGRLVFSENLVIAERYYTKQNDRAEYYQVTKNHELIYSDNNVTGSYDNMVYAGSVVVSGKGRAIVTAIGAETRAAKKKCPFNLAAENDSPDFLDSFRIFTKRFSLAVLISIIPVSLFTVFTATQNNNDGETTGILYTFLIFLALSVISMGELISAPATLIVSHTLFPGKRTVNNGVTRMSATEKIAAADTLLIMCPETLVDKRHFVRRVFYSDKEYRFDSLRSAELDSFSIALEAYLKQHYGISRNGDIKALYRFVSLRNKKVPNNSLVASASAISPNTADAVAGCEFFRTDGGSLWRFSEETRQKLFDSYNRYIDLGLKVALFTSIDEQEHGLVFEGMIAIGEEYPFADGTVFSDYTDNGITPVLVLENESQANIKLALNCGMVKSIDEIVFASALASSNKTLSDAPIHSKVYIGFGRNGTKELVKRYNDAGKRVLPIIKELADKSAILPLNVYATHSDFSSECVKYTSSLSLRNADSEASCGGVKDSFESIKNSRRAFYKTNVFKRYLTFATVFRIVFVMLALLSDSAVRNASALMILLSGLLADGAALLAVLKSKEGAYTLNRYSERVPVLLFAAAGMLVALASHITVCVLTNGNFILPENVQTVQLYLSLLTQLIGVGVFILTPINKICKSDFNIYYFLTLIAFVAYVFIQNWIPNEVFSALSPLAFSRMDLRILPPLFIPGALSFVLISLIGKISRKLIK